MSQKQKNSHFGCFFCFSIEKNVYLYMIFTSIYEDYLYPFLSTEIPTNSH